jgi:hypothetical protein
MKRLELAVVAMFVLGGCRGAWALRTTHTLAITVEPSSQLVKCAVPPRLTYGSSRRLFRSAGTYSPITVEEHPRALPVTISNGTDEVVTIDWEHSAFVDSRGNSYRVRLYRAEGASTLSDTGPRSIDKPPVPVIAPGAHVQAFVLPEQDESQPFMFFAPPSSSDGAPLKLVVSVAGPAFRHAECVIRSRLEQTTVTRSTQSRWPQHGQTCLPDFGCADGLLCASGICNDPRKPPSPPRTSGKRAGEKCEIAEDCAQGLRCDWGRQICVKR